MTDKIVVLCTCSSDDEAAKISRLLVELRLAACVNTLPGLRSTYRWQGAIVDSAEFLLLIKTRRDLFQDLKAAIQSAHSYRVPEVIALPIVDGAVSYLEWLAKETREPDEEY